MGEGDERYLLATAGGYGFVTALENLWSKSRTGKVVITVPDNDRLLAPVPVGTAPAGDVAVVSSDGYLLVYPIDELPELSRGKGVKLMGIPPRRLRDRLESVCALAVVGAGESLTVVAGRRHLTLRPRELEGYRGVRSNRGRSLPRGLRKVDSLAAGPRGGASGAAANGREGRPGADN